MTRFRPVAALALALAVAAPLGAALASSDGSRADRRTAEAVTPASARFDAPAAIAAVLGAGYTAISELDWERGAWEVKALDAHGRRVELRVDATTGAVVPRGRCAKEPGDGDDCRAALPRHGDTRHPLGNRAAGAVGLGGRQHDG